MDKLEQTYLQMITKIVLTLTTNEKIEYKNDIEGCSERVNTSIIEVNKCGMSDAKYIRINGNILDIDKKIISLIFDEMYKKYEEQQCFIKNYKTLIEEKAIINEDKDNG